MANLFVVSAPSGAGKSTLTQRVIDSIPDIQLSISCTTRPIRGDEQHGREYYFLTQEEFFERRNAGDFLESAQVHGNYYGTSKEYVQKILDQGKSVIFDIDVQGAANLRQTYPEAVLIFIAPPSVEELERRLRERKTDDPREIEKRLSNARGEMVEAKHYNYMIINDDLEVATNELEVVIKGKPLDKSSPAEVLKRLLPELNDEQKPHKK